jgi:hypothetical protein
MFERGISVKSVAEALRSGETIEDYSADMPEPGRLILSFQGRRPFHVVATGDTASSEITVITVYVPDPDRWNNGFRSRRS